MLLCGGRGRAPKSSNHKHLQRPTRNFPHFSFESSPRYAIMAPMRVSTRFQKSIRPVEGNTILKPGRNNKKLGFKITSKRWKGKKLYSLTLTERDTCPTSCHHWEDCYGDNMPFAHRFRAVGLEQKLETELAALIESNPSGIVVRLHVLGDFYSIDYVKFWEEMLFKHPSLCLFGYTGREEDLSLIHI